MQLALDPQESRRRKREGQDLVSSKNSAWLKIMLADLAEFALAHGEFVFESFRWNQISTCRPQPSSPQAWGSVGTHARRLHIIEGTERYVLASSAKTHAHPVEIVRCAVEREPIPFGGWL